MAKLVSILVQSSPVLEFDYALYHVSANDQARIENSFYHQPFLTTDLDRNGQLSRKFDEFDVWFERSASQGHICITLLGLRPPLKQPRLARWQRALELLATLRSGTGI